MSTVLDLIVSNPTATCAVCVTVYFAGAYVMAKRGDFQ